MLSGQRPSPEPHQVRSHLYPNSTLHFPLMTHVSDLHSYECTQVHVHTHMHAHIQIHTFFWMMTQCRLSFPPRHGWVPCITCPLSSCTPAGPGSRLMTWSTASHYFAKHQDTTPGCESCQLQQEAGLRRGLCAGQDQEDSVQRRERQKAVLHSGPGVSKHKNSEET